METPQNSIKIVEVSQISPSENNETDQIKSLNLTFFDLLWIKFHPIERLFFYEFTGLSTTNFYSTILRRLKHSLSLALSHFRPLAGKLTSSVQYVDGKVVVGSFLDATYLIEDRLSYDDFSQVMCNYADIEREGVQLRLIYVCAIDNEERPADFGGIQTGVSSCRGSVPPRCSNSGAGHHAILDGKSSAMFIKSWAYLSKNFDQENLPSDLVPCFDRTVIKDQTGKLDMFYLDMWVNLAAKMNSKENPRSLKELDFGANKGDDLVRATFDFSREDIKKLREKVQSNSIDHTNLYISSFTLTYAHAIICFVKAKGLESNEKVNFAFAADFRSRLVPPVPENYLGNYVGSKRVKTVEVKDIVRDELGLVIVAKNISDSIKELGKDGYLERIEEIFNSYSKLEPSLLGIIGVAGSPKLEIYGVDFGWGKPKKVDIVSIDKAGSFSMTESRDQIGGIEIGLVMKTQEELQAFASLFVQGLHCTNKLKQYYREYFDLIQKICG
ncbi:phenolic glucoside malonyltransferase 1-like [Rutidosis leptorrhynchoides]|uniref:phenolic glucoside malonyltransferase 1-like n=1 Tax=Rutidosis leptorrhynchoides TaxID=125765 RepID=UPI003A99164E